MSVERTVGGHVAAHQECLGIVALLPAVIKAEAEVFVSIFVAQAQVVGPTWGVEAVFETIARLGAVEAGVGGVGPREVAAG